MHAVSHTVGKVGRKEGVVSYRNKVPVSLFSVRQQPGEEVDAPSLSPFACPPPFAYKGLSSAHLTAVCCMISRLNNVCLNNIM